MNLLFDAILWILAAVCTAGVAAVAVWLVIGPKRGGNAARGGILVYHRVEKGPVLGSTWIGARGFRRQMSFLLNAGYKCVDLDAKLLSGSTKEFCITFDDALLCLYENAVPVLDALGLTATFYIVSGYIGRLSHWDVYQRPHMDQDQIRELLRKGHRIGSHTATHPDLRRLSDTELRTELEGSKADLENRFGVAINSIAYPFGFYNDRVAQAAARAGYGSALTINHPLQKPVLERMAIPANAVYIFDSLADLEAKASANSLYWMQELKGKLLNRFTAGTPLVVGRPYTGKLP